MAQPYMIGLLKTENIQYYIKKEDVQLCNTHKLLKYLILHMIPPY